MSCILSKTQTWNDGGKAFYQFCFFLVVLDVLDDLKGQLVIGEDGVSSSLIGTSQLMSCVYLTSLESRISAYSFTNRSTGTAKIDRMGRRRKRSLVKFEDSGRLHILLSSNLFALPVKKIEGTLLQSLGDRCVDSVFGLLKGLFEERKNDLHGPVANKTSCAFLIVFLE